MKLWCEYHWFLIRCWWLRLLTYATWWVAWRIPRRVALIVFIRVYGAAYVDPGPEYKLIYNAWEAGAGR